MRKAKDFLDDILQDDDTTFGGISYNGEKLKDFIGEVGLSEDVDMEYINMILKECGIKQIFVR